jgi:hypothetical protein
MNKIYKIFGAVAIIGLFAICSMSTGLAAPQAAQPQQSPEPLGIIPADLVFQGRPQKDLLDRIHVYVRNDGPGFAWMPYVIKVHVTGIFNGDDLIEGCFNIIPGGQTTEYVTRPFVGGLLGRTATVTLDYSPGPGFGRVWEGFLGETNNAWVGIL